MTKKLAFDPTAARKVLQVAKSKQLPKAAVEALYGTPPAWGLGKLPFIGAVHPKGMGSQHAQVLRGAPSGALLQSAPAFNVMRTGILEQGHAASAIPSLQGQHKKMLEAVVKGHELAELQSPLGASMLGFGHNSPEVMLREHNMVTTLPAEHAPVKEFLGLARKSRESKMLAQYGVEYGESPRLSRHARKHIASMMEADASKPIRSKLAEVATELKPHQQRVVDRIMKQPGLVVAHGMGSGKTLTSIAAAEKLKGPTSVLVPAALQTNYQKELDKHVAGAPEAQYEVGSLQRAALHGAPASKLQIVDEAHRLRDPSSATRKAVRDSGAEKRLLLTGTALYNKPYDLASLVNLAAGDNIFPGSQSDFDSRYLTEKVTDPGWFARNLRGVKPGSTTVLRERNKEELGKHLNQWVDFHENSTEGFPTRKDENIGTQLSPKQKQLYDFALKDAPAWVRYKIQKGLPPSKSESKDLNAFSGAVRQVSNSPGGFDQEMTPDEAAAHSPKIQEAYKRLEAGIAANPNHRALVYSNYLASGLTPYEALLKKNNIAYGKFTGEVGKAERDGMVRDYNEGKLKALLLSSAGGEGLDLKGTRQIQVLEPHWNKEKLEQVIARGIRYKSHEHLPEDQRAVNVEHYTSQMQEPGALRKLFGAKRQGSIDEYLQMMSNEKDQLNQQVRGLLTRNQPTQKSAMLALVEEHQELLESCGSVA